MALLTVQDEDDNHRLHSIRHVIGWRWPLTTRFTTRFTMGFSTGAIVVAMLAVTSLTYAKTARMSPLGSTTLMTKYAEEDPREPNTSESEIPERPALRAALIEMLREWQRLYEANLLEGPGDGSQPHESDAKDSPFEKFRRETINAIDDQTIQAAWRSQELNPKQVIELHLHRRGMEIFEKALSQDPDIRPLDLLSMMDVVWLQDTPLMATEAYEHAQEEWVRVTQGLDTEFIHPFGNVSVQWILWGAVHHPHWLNPAEREEFILDLLDLGLTHRALAEITLAALEPPTRCPPDQAPDTKAAGIDTSLAKSVGFQASHRLWCEEQRQALAEIQSLETDATEHNAATGSAKGSSEQTPQTRDQKIIRHGNLTYLIPTPTGHLNGYVAEVHRRVLQELNDGDFELLRFGLQEERLMYWRMMFTKYGWAAVWPQAKQEITELLTFCAHHRLNEDLTAMWAEFQPYMEEIRKYYRSKYGDSQPYSLPASARAQFDRYLELLEIRDREQAELLNALCEAMATLADAPTAARELHGFEELTQNRRDAGEHAYDTSVFRRGWRSLVYGDLEWSEQQLRDHFRDPEANAASDYATTEGVSGLQFRLSIGPDAGAADLLHKIGMEGHDLARACVFVNTRGLDAGAVQEMHDAAIRDFNNSNRSRVLLGQAAVKLLRTRAQEAPDEVSSWIQTALVATFEAGHWRRDPPILTSFDQDTIQWAATLLTDKQFTSLRDRQLLSADVIRERTHR